MFVTFVPRTGFFRCHPLPILLAHGMGLGVPHKFIIIDEQNWLECYRRAFAFLKTHYGIEQVISGDILSTSLSDDYWLTGVPNFHISRTAWINLLKTFDIEFVTPLSGLYAEDILSLLDTYKLSAVVTGVAAEWFAEGLLGRCLNLDLLQSIPLYADRSFDLCGERGEYHTTIIDYNNIRFCSLDPTRLDYILFNKVWVLNWPSQWLERGTQRTSF